MGILSGLTQRIKQGFATEKRSMQLSPYTSTGFSQLFSQVLTGYNHSGQNVTAETSLRLSAIYGCVRNISEDIAKAEIKLLKYDKKTGNYVNLNNHPIYNLLNVKPNGYSLPFAFREAVQQNALLRGNGYAYIKRNSISGEPEKLVWLQPESVNPMIVNNSQDNPNEADLRMIYLVNDPRTGIQGTFQAYDILHIRGMGNGYVGVSVVAYASESFGKALATQQFGATFFGSNGVKGVLKFAGQNDENKLRKAKASFKRAYQEDGLAVVNQGVEWEKVDIGPEEAQFVQSSEFNVADIARWFRMPLSKLQKSDQVTDVEREAIEYVNDCLLSWQIRWQQEIMTKLISPIEQNDVRIEFNNDYLLKGDSASQERRIKTMFYVGAWSPNDALRYMGYDVKETPESDETFMPVNMIPASNVSEFWMSKNPSSNIPQASADSTGSGASNNNINQ